MVEVMKIMATSFKRSHAGTAALSTLSLQQATTDPRFCQRLLDTHGEVWVSLLLGHCSFLLGPGEHKFLFVPSKSLFPESCVSSGDSMVGLMATSSKRAHAIPRSVAPSPCSCGRPLLTCTSTGDTKTLTGRSDTVSVGSSGAYEVLSEPSEHLWWGRVLILGVILPLLPSFLGFSFPLDVGCLFLVGSNIFLLMFCAVVSCNFGVLAGEDKRASFYSAILLNLREEDHQEEVATIHRRTIKKGLQITITPDNHDGVITRLGPGILE